MSYYKKVLIITTLLVTLALPTQALGYIADAPAEATTYYTNLSGGSAPVAGQKVTRMDLVKLLLATTNFDPSQQPINEFIFNDVPAADRAYADKARVLGLVFFNSANPNFGYNENLSIKKAAELALKFYGLSVPKMLIDEASFSQKAGNISVKNLNAPLAERGLLYGIFESRNGQVELNKDITEVELADLLYNLNQLQKRLLDSNFTPSNKGVTNPTNNTKKAPTTSSSTSSRTEKVSADSIQAEPTFKILDDVWKRIQKEYYDKNKVSKQEMIYGAITGLVDSLGDPYTTFQIPELQEAFRDTLNNQVEGIGASLEMNQSKQLVIVAPLPGSPAQKAGLKAKDIITKIDGVSTEKMSLSQAVLKIKGTAGTKVKLEISRAGKTLEFTITRAAITVPTVNSEITADNIAVISVRNFGLGIEETVNDYLDQLDPKTTKGIVLDLRNNPGGYLDSAVEIAGNFVDRGEVITKVKYGSKSTQTEKSTGTGEFKGIPLAVLINGGSASASEVLAAALKDKANAKLIGEKSFGKGTVQELVTYKDDSALKLTIAHWLTPNNVDVNKVGLSPDIAVVASASDLEVGNDPQLNRALAELRK